MSQHTSERVPRVVIVEADQALAQFLLDALAHDGCGAVICERPDAAVQIIERERPALVVLGLDLATSKAAWTLLNQLRAAPRTAWLPIVFVTADQRLACEQGLLLRAEGYALIETPFDVDDFLDLVRTQLRAGRRQPRSGEAERPPPTAL